MIKVKIINTLSVDKHFKCILPFRRMDILSVLNNTWGADMGKTGVSSFLRRYRSKHGLSREALAEKLDISDSYLAALELGTRKPSYDTLLKIVNTLEVSVDSVIGTDGYVGKLEEKSEISIALNKLYQIL